MQKAGFDNVFLGIESPNPGSLREANKKQNLVDVPAAIAKIQSYGMAVMGGFMVGFDHDTKEIFDQMIEFIQKTGVVLAMVGPVIAPPKTPLWERLKKAGRINDNAWGNNTDGNTNIVPVMGLENLKKGYSRLVKTIYSAEYYYKRIEELLKHLKPAGRKRFSWRDTRAFFWSIWHLGWKSKEDRVYYWKLVYRTATTNYRLLSTAVTLAIYRYHLGIVARTL
jgi:radical SAM superfamily enzyme YgiQ (UPF0313 family)